MRLILGFTPIVGFEGISERNDVVRISERCNVQIRLGPVLTGLPNTWPSMVARDLAQTSWTSLAIRYRAKVAIQ